MSDERSPNRTNGDRDAHGRFLPGCKGGPGNPLGKRIAQLRTALVEAVTVEDMTAIARKLVALAREGDTLAARILFDRVLGKPLEADIIGRVEELEEAMEGAR